MPLTVRQAGPAYSARLGELSADEQEALRAALRRVEDAESLGEWISAVKLQDGSWRMPYARLADEASELLRVVEQVGLHIPFDWPSWEQGRKLAQDPAFETAASPAEAAMLIVTLTRQDRFVDGALLQALQAGIIQRATRRLLDAAPRQ